MVLASSWSSASIGIGGIGHLTFLCWLLSFTSWKRSSTISIPVDFTHWLCMGGTARIQQQMFQETQLHHQSVPSMCEQCVRHPMLRVLALSNAGGHGHWILDFKLQKLKVEGFTNVSWLSFPVMRFYLTLGRLICQLVRQMFPSAGWR